MRCPMMLSGLVLAGLTCPLFADGPLRGKYVEARTCQVYTGPCFANGEVGSAGKNAILTWRIEGGSIAGTDLSGCSVAVLVKASDTLGFQGFADAKTTRAMVIVDETADDRQSAALKQFVQARTGIEDEQIASVQRAPIEMQFDVDQLTAIVDVGDLAHVEARKARKGDCICSNESAYYPPLTELLGFVPGVTIEGEVSARPLGTRWSIPGSRSAYLGTFSIRSEPIQIAATR